jgi:hypothetical protein
MDAEGRNEQHAVREVLLQYIRQPAFKRTLQQVLVAQNTHDFRSVAVLSQFPGEGKTFVTSVLALALATFLGKRVLIMDTVSNSREESWFMESVLGDSGPNLSMHGRIDVLTPRNYAEEEISTNAADGTTVVSNERSLVAKPSIKLPALVGEESLSVGFDFKMSGLINAFRGGYDMILLDTCAMSAVTQNDFEPLVVAQQADAVLLVTSGQSLDEEVVQRIHAELSRAKIKLVGTIHNTGI